ncbi:hypothetical protein SK128_007062 [Halocaridina rubra]|uniref:Uncharacterized protein n=1 Tax=Halocaridina rubra TaxID=373956 RepID=A0AAN9AHL2_HALRR
MENEYWIHFVFSILNFNGLHLNLFLTLAVGKLLCAYQNAYHRSVICQPHSIEEIFRTPKDLN